jgi:opacity protein-like surface antigen
MRTKNFIFFSFILLLVVTAAPAMAIDLGGHIRDGYVINFNMGPAWNELEFTVPDIDGNPVAHKTNAETDLAGGIGIGWARGDYLIVSLGVYGSKSYQWYYGDQFSVSTTQFQLDACVFPWGEGFWLKGGIGPGNISFNAVVPRINITFQEWDWNVVGGAGYELRLSDTVAFGAAYEYRTLGVGAFEGLEDTKVTSHNALFSLRWYMQ